jgi:integration host factor subunit beta
LTCLAILATFRTTEGFTLIKSELVDRISIQNPHLYRHDAEKIVNAIFSEIAAAMARGDRVELRGFGVFFVRVRAGPGRPDRTKSSHRGSGFGRKQGRSSLQERQGNEVSA